MGWDAFSKVTESWDDKMKIADKKSAKAFKKASKFVVEQCKTVDFLLEHGGLDCSSCAYMLQEATSMDCWGKDLSVEDVKKYNDSADWSFKYRDADAWAYWSARKFLETCAELNLSIRFSW